MRRTISRFSVPHSITSLPTGIIMAPPAPCRTRQAVKLHCPWLNPHSTEAPVNIAIRGCEHAPGAEAIRHLAADRNDDGQSERVGRYADVQTDMSGVEGSRHL